MSKLSIEEISHTKKEVSKFIHFARKVYGKNHPYYVDPIYSEQIKFILKGPFNRIGEKILLMVYRDGSPVARASFHRSFAHNEHYNTNQGFWGWFEAFNDPEAVKLLFETGFQWLKEKGCQSSVGPMNFTIYDEIGMLIEGFDSIPAILCTYNPEYYPQLICDLGFQKEIDWYAYWRPADTPIPPLMDKLAKRLERNSHVRIREANMKNWNNEIKAVHSIFNHAWSENWGHVPLNDEQWDVIIHELKQIVRKDLALILEADGKTVGFCITIPDANAAVKKAKGSLWPFGVFKILWNLRKINTVRTIIMGIEEDYRRHGYDFALVHRTIKNGVAVGMTGSDCSLLAETNTRIIEGVTAMGAYKYKTYRIYKKEIE